VERLMQRDGLRGAVRGTVNFGVYGAPKVWLQLNREGITVARCTHHGRRQAADRAADLVRRDFAPTAIRVRPDMSVGVRHDVSVSAW
jgi:hypothetical protein